MKNKRGEGFHIGFTILYALMWGAILFVMGWVLYLTTNNYLAGFLAYEKDIPRHVYAYRAINTCLAYQDEDTQRFYPGVIDYSKYDKQTLKDCYTNTEVTSFNFQLWDLKKDNPYDRILIGFGATLSIKSYPVWIRYDDGSFSEGKLLIGVS
ncbi:hypothetical protein AYK26_01850 [Euryarchaeota archaeon SM23-78]|nr:MAG: hypothetical protein AYK26_01850 [Euryarchaeota archaeon SM23-78]MBW3000339.1 hypothetical protein [Candidatus Woesearchaeota archaeon]